MKQETFKREKAGGRWFISAGGRWSEITERSFNYIRVMSFSFEQKDVIQANNKIYTFFEAIL